MIKINLRPLLVSSLFVLGITVVPDTLHAQSSASEARFSPQASGYIERARVMSDAGNYVGAIDQLREIDTENLQLSLSLQEEYVYLLANALYERGDKECLRMLLDFRRNYPASPMSMEVALKIGDYYFFRHQWSDALTEYTSLDFARLNREQKLLYSYRLALCEIKTGHFNEARKTLHALSNAPQYRDAYNFYTAYLDYIAGKYDEAYALFSKVKSKEKGLESAYYMTQIDYTRGKYDEVAEKGEKLLQKLDDPELAPELNRITGLSLFKTGDTDRAVRFLSRYLDTCVGDPAPDAVYTLGICDYNNGDYERAAERFSTLTELNNDIAQSAWLYLGQCDIKNGNDDAAAIAFEKAARMDYDRDVSETALYNYVAALTRGGKVPFASSADMLEGFIKLYPNSEYTPKVEGYLAEAYYNDHNYTKALENIEKIRKPSQTILAAKQKVLYQLGIEAMSNSRTQEAVKMFSRSLELASYDRALALQTQLWLGDALYATGSFAKAQSAYSTFINGEKASSNKTLAMYNLAYAEYQQDKYANAASTFRKALDAKPTLPNALEADAYIRMGDCLYYSGNYKSAQTAYSKAIEMGAADADYATYRHAVMRGLGGDINGKIEELAKIRTEFPYSKWIPNSLMEKAMTFQALDRNREAAEAFDQLASSYPQTAQARKAMLNLAFTYAKAGDNIKATDTYKEIIRSWPSSEEADVANTDLRRYYSSTGAMQEYAAFLKSVPEAKQLDSNELEQIAFDGAETAYAENPDNIAALQAYVRDYPDGKYLAQALLDIAASQRANHKFNEAEESLAKIITSRPHSAQYPEALLSRAEILEYDLPGRTEDAAECYRQLEKSGNTDFIADAYAGIVRTSSEPDIVIEYARKARNAGGVAAEVAEEMSYCEATALMKKGEIQDALELLTSLAESPASEAGAKAAVELGKYLISQKQFSEAEKAMLKFTETGTPHQFQLAQGFILLADAYHGLGKTYLAKEYLQSLKQNYPGNEPEIMNAITQRLKSYK